MIITLFLRYVILFFCAHTMNKKLIFLYLGNILKHSYISNNLYMIKYPIDLFIKYKRHSLPLDFNEYRHHNDNFWKKKQNAGIHTPEIKSLMNLHMTKKNVDNEDENLYDKIQSLLNKLSNMNFDDIGSEIKDLPYIKKKHIYKLCESIIIKSINEKGFCVMYAKLSHSLLPYYIIENSETGEKTYFRIALLTICQDIFGELTNADMEKGTPKYDRSIDYSKLKLSGLTKLLAELYNYDVLNDKIINQCFATIYAYILKGCDNYEFYEALHTFIVTFAQKMHNNNKILYTKIKNDISNLIFSSGEKEISFESVKYVFKYSKLIYKFKIMEIIEHLEKIN